jgi:hypothetical protein
LRDVVGTLDPAALAVASKDATIFFLPMMLKELEAAAMAGWEQGGR